MGFFDVIKNKSGGNDNEGTYEYADGRCHDRPGSYCQLLKGDNLTRGVNVQINDNKITLSFHVIVAYGVSISAVSDNLMSNVKYKVEEFTGMTIEKINIFVEGVRVID